MENNIEKVKDGSVYVNDDHDHIDMSVHKVIDVKYGRWKTMKIDNGKEFKVKSIDVKTKNGSWFQLNLFKEG